MYEKTVTIFNYYESATTGRATMMIKLLLFLGIILSIVKANGWCWCSKSSKAIVSEPDVLPCNDFRTDSVTFNNCNSTFHTFSPTLYYYKSKSRLTTLCARAVLSTAIFFSASCASTVYLAFFAR